MLLGRMIITNWNSELDKEVEKELNRVIMLDVPPIDTAVGMFLDDNHYNHKYLTAIDINTDDYGIYEIENDEVVAFAHGKCVSTGKAIPGFYEIQDTKSHIDYHNVRYWRVVNLKEKSSKNELVVSSSGYEIDNVPNVKIEDDGTFGNVMIDSDIMLTVYDNSEPGIILIVIDSGERNDN